MTRISFWILLALFVQIALCSAAFAVGIFNAPALRGGLLADIAKIFSFYGLAYLSLSVVAFASFAQDTRLGRCVGWAALCVIALSILNAIIGTIADHSTRQGVGWVLYPPLNTFQPTSYFNPNDPSDTGLMMGFTLKAIMESVAMMLSMAGCVVILGKRHTVQPLVVGTCVILGAFALWAGVTLWNGGYVQVMWPYYGLVGMVVLVAATSPDLRTRPEAHYMLAAIVLLVVSTASLVWIEYLARPTESIQTSASDIYYVVNTSGFWASTFPVFILFAGLLAWLKPTIQGRVTRWHAVGLFVTTTLAIIPLVALIGMPRRYVDYDPTMGLYALAQGLAGLVAAILVIGGIVVIALRRTR